MNTCLFNYNTDNHVTLHFNTLHSGNIEILVNSLFNMDILNIVLIIFAFITHCHTHHTHTHTHTMGKQCMDKGATMHALLVMSLHLRELYTFLCRARNYLQEHCLCPPSLCEQPKSQLDLGGVEAQPAVVLSIPSQGQGLETNTHKNSPPLRSENGRLLSSLVMVPVENSRKPVAKGVIVARSYDRVYGT